MPRSDSGEFLRRIFMNTKFFEICGSLFVNPVGPTGAQIVVVIL